MEDKKEKLPGTRIQWASGIYANTTQSAEK